MAFSTAIAAGYDWTQKITYANHPGNRSTSADYTYRTKVNQPQRESSPESVPLTSFKVGDTVAVAAASANLKIADRVVATVLRGERIRVSSVVGAWVGTTIDQNGRSIAGWILASDLATSSDGQIARR